MYRILPVMLFLVSAALLFVPGCGKPQPQSEEKKVMEREAWKETVTGRTGGGETADKYASQRFEMVSIQLELRGIRDSRVLEAMRVVPRHLFVPYEYRDDSYGDTPLPIGYGQTISQPYIVALMTELLGLNRNSKVLEVGTGSGYQAAVLSYVAGEVYSIEIVKGLYERAGSDLKKAGYAGVKTLHGDGYYGWEEHAPYDAIIVTCASEFIPPPLLSQLKNGGRMCIPVGPPFKVQHLLLVSKSLKGEVSVEMITEVRFVPLVRAWE